MEPNSSSNKHGSGSKYRSNSINNPYKDGKISGKDSHGNDTYPPKA